MLKFPVRSLVTFMHNHHMLQIYDSNKPLWRTVSCGSREYMRRAVDKLREAGADLRTSASGTAVSIERVQKAGRSVVIVRDSIGREQEYDKVVFACHADTALHILGEGATKEEKSFLSAIPYAENRAVLHRDARLMPKLRKVWASWNTLLYSDPLKRASHDRVSCTYWMNRLQTWIPRDFDVFVTLNPVVEPDPSTILYETTYHHPVFLPQSAAAQQALLAHNAHSVATYGSTFFCGAYTGFGFHEDGFYSGVLAALHLGAKTPWEVDHTRFTVKGDMHLPTAGDLFVRALVPLGALAAFAGAAFKLVSAWRRSAKGA